MTDRENFLERWSRRKRKADDAAQSPDSVRPPVDGAATAPVAAPGDRGERKDVAKEPAVPVFDLASLPSLDAITEATDVRAFLQPGVPHDLTVAALRRAWELDPAIRNFVGLQEYDWDFNNPRGHFGFDDLPADFDVQKMARQIMGEREEDSAPTAGSEPVAAAPPGPQVVAAVEQTAMPEPGAAVVPPMAADDGPAAASPQSMPTAPAQDVIVQSNNNTAPQHGDPEDQPKQTDPRRQHGGALPKS